MSKSSGLGDNLYIDGYDLSGDIGSLSRVGGSRAALDVTGIDKAAFERVHGIRDGAIEFTSFFNAADGQAHPKLSALPTADVIVSYFRGATVGNAAACLVAKQIGYDPTRGTDGALTLNTSAQANGYGLEWGVMLTAGVQSDSEATDSASFDLGAAGANGAQAYLHVFSVTGTSCTVSIESSSDDGGDDDFASLIDFTAATDRTAERKTVTGAVEQYLRVSTSGTFSECSFAVAIKVNKTAVTF